jgi:predicted HTH transcriptional regulator
MIPFPKFETTSGDVEETCKRIMKALKSTGRPCTVSDLVNITRSDEDTTRRAIGRLIASGYLKTTTRIKNTSIFQMRRHQ